MYQNKEMLPEFRYFSNFMQFCYKSRFVFNVCNIKILENTGPDEIHSIGEKHMVNCDCISKNC